MREDAGQGSSHTRCDATRAEYTKRRGLATDSVSYGCNVLYTNAMRYHKLSIAGRKGRDVNAAAISSLSCSSRLHGPAIVS